MVKEEQVLESFKAPFPTSLHGLLLPKKKENPSQRHLQLTQLRTSFVPVVFTQGGIDQEYSEANI